MKRYRVVSSSGCSNCDMEESPDGEYVRWDDVLVALGTLTAAQIKAVAEEREAFLKQAAFLKEEHCCCNCCSNGIEMLEGWVRERGS